MKYSLFGLSQAALVQHNMEHPDYSLNGDDIVILSMLYDFFMSAKKEGSKIKRIDIDNTPYYYIKHKTIAEELPVFMRCSKTIERHMTKYVMSGLLNKLNRRGGANGGEHTYYAITDEFKSLKYDKNNAAQKVNPLTQPTAEHDSPTDKDASVPPNPPAEHDCTSDKDAIVPPAAENEDSNVPPNQSLTISNPTIKKNPVHHSLLSCDTSTSAERKKGFFNAINKIFGFIPVLSPDPYPVIAEYFMQHNIDESHMQDYLQDLYDYLLPRCKNRESFISFYAKSMITPYNMNRWWSQYQMTQKFQAEDMSKAAKAEAARQADLVTCPVCGCLHNIHDYDCPICHSASDCGSNETELSIARDVWFLKQTEPKKATLYEAECRQVISDMLSGQWMRQSPDEKSKATDDRNNRLNEIRNRYFGCPQGVISERH